MLSWSATSTWTRSRLRRLFQRDRVRRARGPPAGACGSTACGQRRDGGLGRGRVAGDERAERRGRGRGGPGRTGPRAGRRPSSSWACAGCSRAAAGRGRRHRRRTAARGSSPGGRGRCPSACRASCHRREPRRGSWWSACPGAPRRAGRRPPGGSAGRWSARRRSRRAARRCRSSCPWRRRRRRSRRPRRSSACWSPCRQAPFAAVRTRTTPPLGPGTAPLISSRPLARRRPRAPSGSGWSGGRRPCGRPSACP